MSDIWKALPYHLIHNTGLAALVSTRIYPMRLPQGATLPALCYQDISSQYTQSHGEKSALPRPRFQFTIYGVTVDSVNSISTALKNAIDGYKGSMGTGSYITIVEACLLKNEYSNDETATEGIVYRFQDYVIQYKE